MRSLSLIFSICLGCSLFAQDSVEIKKIQITGYVKDMQSLNFGNDLSNLSTGNLIHNRINIKILPSKQIKGAIEVRNRLFWGEEVRLLPAFSSQLRNRNEALDLTWNVVDEERMVLNTTVDRVWLEYRKQTWNVRVGRQRINWCIGTTWNPNDLFNTYNFLDFDYEERPGADGITFQYFTRDMDHLEFATSYSENKELISAIKYFRNVANYDLQFIAGSYKEQMTIGFGWSGSIRETGFKGEMQYFFKHGLVGDQVNLVIEGDHLFPKGWYLRGGMFLNSTGIDESLETMTIAAMQLSPRNLMPTRWNGLFSFSKELTPLTSLTTSFIYAPGSNLLMVLPAISYNLAENLDVNLVWQSFFSEQNSSFDDLSHRCFIRFKWSY